MADRTPLYHENALLGTNRVLWSELQPNVYGQGVGAYLKIADANVSDANPLPVDCVVVPDAAWLTPVNGEIFNAVQTAYNSAEIDVSGKAGLVVLIFVDSTGAPTDVRVLPQVSDDGGTTWWDFEEGLWASLFWEDTDTAAGIRKRYYLPIAGEDLVRFRIIATGTGALATFEVTVRARGFRGPHGVAHA